MKFLVLLTRSSAKVAILLVLLPLLAACGGEVATSTVVPPTVSTQPTATSGTSSDAVATNTTAPVAATNTTAPVAAATDTPGPVTLGTGATKIVWWHISTAPDQKANWQDLANKYVQDHPNVSIEITVLENEAFKSKLATSMQSGNPPDLFQSWGGGVLAQYAQAGLVQDLTSALSQNGWGDSFQSAPLGLYKVGDKNYGVPWEAGMVGFWYNKGLFEQAGIDAPPTSWTALLDDVKKLKDAKITPIAIGGKDEWPGAFWWEYLATRLGGETAFQKAYDRSGSFADKPFVDAGTMLKQLVDLQPFQTGFLGAAYPDQQVLMANGQAAMELMGQWAPGADRAVAKDVNAYTSSLGFFPFPSVDGGAGDPGDVLGGADGFAIGKNAPPETIDFVRYLTNLENQSAMAAAGTAVLPVIKGAEKSLKDPLMQEVAQRVAAAKYYQLYYDQFMSPAVGQAVNDQTATLFAATGTADAVAKAIDDAVASDK
ncbi:MAG TPA: extracellular solute-binding protein [Chloroflexia bacterium]|nr:extracellular solute-binding protein [Chloroflexia bacterium]